MQDDTLEGSWDRNLSSDSRCNALSVVLAFVRIQDKWESLISEENSELWSCKKP